MVNLQEIEKKMLRMGYAQHELNVITNGANWMGLGRQWHRAIWVEAGELMQYIGGWEWWKAAKTDTPQVKLELIDIWHFGLSLSMNFRQSVEQGVDDIMNEASPAVTRKWVLVDAIERMAYYALKDQRFDSQAFFDAWYGAGGDFEELYRLYNAKRVLNRFRQAHGYAEGQYVKMWGENKEDNYYLVGIVAEVPSGVVGDEDFERAVLAALKTKYYRVMYGGKLPY
jgi:hypothetical protein